MKYNELQLERHKLATRVGRGISAGKGKTAGRGTKGQKSRTGSKRRPGFEGGQNPLVQRLPKLRGFKSHKQAPDVVYTSQVEAIKASKIDNHALEAAGLVDSAHTNVKLLAKGSLTRKVTVHLQGASTGAVKAIEKAGGSFVKSARIARAAKKTDVGK